MSRNFSFIFQIFFYIIGNWECSDFCDDNGKSILYVYRKNEEFQCRDG